MTAFEVENKDTGNIPFTRLKSIIRSWFLICWVKQVEGISPVSPLKNRTKFCLFRSSQMFFKKVFLKTPVTEPLFKLSCRLSATLLKDRLRQRCFPVKFTTFSRQFFWQNIFGGCFYLWRSFFLFKVTHLQIVNQNYLYLFCHFRTPTSNKVYI